MAALHVCICKVITSNLWTAEVKRGLDGVSKDGGLKKIKDVLPDFWAPADHMVNYNHVVWVYWQIMWFQMAEAAVKTGESS